jgi:hypothetical protein
LLPKLTRGLHPNLILCYCEFVVSDYYFERVGQAWKCRGLELGALLQVEAAAAWPGSSAILISLLVQD